MLPYLCVAAMPEGIRERKRQMERSRNERPELVQSVPEGLELGLRNTWSPIGQSEELPAETPIALTSLNEDLIVWRGGDRCPHRFRASSRFPV